MLQCWKKRSDSALLDASMTDQTCLSALQCALSVCWCPSFLFLPLTLKRPESATSFGPISTLSLMAHSRANFPSEAEDLLSGVVWNQTHQTNNETLRKQ